MQKNPYAGKFVVFDGPEGGGKTTQVRLLHDFLAEQNIPHAVTKEPTAESIFGRLVRAIYTCESFYDELPQRLDECLYHKEYALRKEIVGRAAERHIRNFENIARELKAGDHTRLPLLLQLGMIFDRWVHRAHEAQMLIKGVLVISDRDFFSTLAYGAAEGVPMDHLLVLHEEILGSDFFVPDCVLLFDVPVEIGLERTIKKQGGKTEHFDKPEVLAHIRENYLKIMERKNFRDLIRMKKIDGSLSPKDVQTTVCKILSLYF